MGKIFKTIIDTYGYTLTIEITISAPPSGRRKRDISDSPVVDVTATLTGEDDGTTTSTVLDNLISTGTTDAYNNYDSSEFGDLIDTSLSPIVSNSEVVYALTGVGCWTCHAGSYVDCAKTGTFEICDEKNSEPPVCFVELRENRQNIISISTGCTHYKACDDLKSQNRANNNPDHDQCRPDFRYQFSSARLDYKTSVCRQCFNTCDLTADDSGNCFGGMNGNHGSEAAFLSDGAFFSYPVEMEKSYWFSSASFSSSVNLGIPISTGISDSGDISYVENNDNKIFWGGSYLQSESGKDSSVINDQTMVYWGLHDQSLSWWNSDLIQLQNSYSSRKQSGNTVF